MEMTERLRERDLSASYPLPDEDRRSMFEGLVSLPLRDSGEHADSAAPAPLLWGESEPMQRLFEMVERVAPTRANVLLIGESGTGKEVIASRVHERSQRAGSPFIAINCGAVPPGLMEAEFFGHERGSFTGAVRSNKGVFERAEDGTLFLDEVTEMPVDLQAKLLRVLETGRYFRIGGDRELCVRCRIVAATNRQPDQAVQDGTLREDLLYRLAVFPLHLPPLRERGDDIDLLAARFVDELNAEYHQEKRLSCSSRAFLRDHTWPGNVRELKNAIHRAYILADHDLQLASARVPLAPGVSSDSHVMVPVGTSIAVMERALIEATLSRCEGNKRQTARILGVSVKTLYNRLNDYDRFERRSGPCAA